MAEQIRFGDGAAYGRSMGVWSRLAGKVFLEWVKPEPGWRWLDVGCGGGAFTELVAERCAPAELHGVDPAEAQVEFARTRPALREAVFQQGDAMALPFPDDRFDAAVMALVIFFVPDPAKGVAEMARVVRPGGVVASYAWDQEAGGSPSAPIRRALRALGVAPPGLPSAEAGGMAALRTVWAGAGLEKVETRTISVRRTFDSFAAFWEVMSRVATVRVRLEPADAERLQARLREMLPADAAGRVTYAAHANAIMGRVPA